MSQKGTDGKHRANGINHSRRRFVQGFAVAGLATLVEGKFNQAQAETIAHSPTILTGTHFALAIQNHEVDFTGRRRRAIKINGSLPGPTLKWREGDTVTIAVTNHLAELTSIHWHGLRIPAPMDGVPGLSFAGIAPGQTFVYRFPIVQNGTYWYHSHSGAQEQIGLIGALIIEPRDKDPIAYDRDYVVLLSDWSDTDADTLYGNLKKQSDYYNYHKRTAGTFIEDVETKGLRSTIADRLMWGRKDMTPADIADVNSSTYIYLMNGNPPEANWTALFNPGERVRLRFINGSAMTLFDVRIPGLPMTVVQPKLRCNWQSSARIKCPTIRLVCQGRPLVTGQRQARPRKHAKHSWLPSMLSKRNRSSPGTYWIGTPLSPPTA